MVRAWVACQSTQPYVELDTPGSPTLAHNCLTTYHNVERVAVPPRSAGLSSTADQLKYCKRNAELGPCKPQHASSNVDVAGLCPTSIALLAAGLCICRAPPWDDFGIKPPYLVRSWAA